MVNVVHMLNSTAEVKKKSVVENHDILPYSATYGTKIVPNLNFVAFVALYM